MRRSLTATPVLMIVLLWLLADTGEASAVARRTTERRPMPLLGHVAHNTPAAVGLLPEDAQPPIPAGRPARSPWLGRASAGAVAAGLVTSFGLLLRRISMRNGLHRLKPAPPKR
jgi:hypothetical protein